jgi:tetratricopeptide (TPR) repeat protein
MAQKNSNEEPLMVQVEEAYSRTERFVDQNRKPLLYGVGGVVVVVLGLLGYRYFVALPAEERAEEAIWRAENYVELDSMDLAVNGDGFSAGLIEVLEQHSGTKAASRAAYRLGIYYRSMGQYDEAIDAFEQVDLGDDVVQAMAEGGAGDCHVEKGDFENAAKAFDRAISIGESGNARDVIVPMYLYKSALVKLELGDAAGAKSDLETIVEEYPTSQSFSAAQGLAASL